MSERSRYIASQVEDATRRAKRVLAISVGLATASLVIRLLVAGGSKAVLAAVHDDVLELTSSLAMLLTLYLENRPRTAKHPYGDQRIGSLTFMASALLVGAIGLFLAWTAARELLAGPTPITGDISLLGFEFWRGWFLMAVVIVTTIPSAWMSYAKQPIPRDLRTRSSGGARSWSAAFAVDW